MSSRILALSLVALFAFTACTRDISGDYSESEAMTPQKVVEGKVINIRHVKVKGNENLTENTGGLLGGGLVGGLIGSQFGKGSGSVIGTLAGAAIGAAGGAAAQRALTKQDGVEYAVRTKNGEIYTVTQGPEPVIVKGQKVLVQLYSKGRSRVIPLSK